jgi:hypothetical protein
MAHQAIEFDLEFIYTPIRFDRAIGERNVGFFERLQRDPELRFDEATHVQDARAHLLKFDVVLLGRMISA